MCLLFQYIYCYSKLLIGILTCFSVLVIPVLINATAFYLDGWSEEDIFRSSHYQAILFLKTRPLIHVVNYKPLTVVIVGVVCISYTCNLMGRRKYCACFWFSCCSFISMDLSN